MSKLLTVVLFVFMLNSEAKVSHEEVDKVVSEIEKIYIPLFKEKYNVNFKIKLKQNNPIYYAFADKGPGNEWFIEIHGGYLSATSMTETTLALLMCHEIGHLDGGEPFFKSSRYIQNASVEGQADFYATNECLKKYLKSKEILAHPKASKSGIAKKICLTSYIEDSEDFIICQHSLNASYNLQKIHKPEDSISFEMNDLSVRDTTLEEHPSSQCRLDTYVMGAIALENDDIQLKKPRCWYAN
jgi:hypothetical protein